MATLLSVSVLATSEGAISPSQQYLLNFSNVVRVKAASTKLKVTYPLANSVILMSKPDNNVKETYEYIVAETLATIAAL